MDDGFSLSPEMAAAAVFYAAVLTAIGACASRFLIASRLSFESRLHLERSAASIGLTAAAVACLALGLRAWTHTLAAFGLTEAFDWQNIQLIAVESRWGQSWIRQAAAGLGMLVTFAAVKAAFKGGWALAALAVALTIVTLPLTGHAAGSPGRLAVHAAHITGAGLWLGSLAVLRFDASRMTHNRPDLAAFRAFAGVAMTGVAVLVVSGLVVSSLYVGEPSHLASSAYGRTLLLKVCVVLSAGWCGYRNWRDLHGDAASRPNLVTARVTQELTFGIVVVILTGVLTGLPQP